MITDFFITFHIGYLTKMQNIYASEILPTLSCSGNLRPISTIKAYSLNALIVHTLRYHVVYHISNQIVTFNFLSVWSLVIVPFHIYLRQVVKSYDRKYIY